MYRTLYKNFSLINTFLECLASETFKHSICGSKVDVEYKRRKASEQRGSLKLDGRQKKAKIQRVAAAAAAAAAMGRSGDGFR